MPLLWHPIQIAPLLARLQLSPTFFSQVACGFVLLLVNEWSRSYRVTNPHPSLPWNFVTHGFLSREGFCRNPRGISRTKSQVNFVRDFLLWVFFGLFLGKNRRKESTQKSTAKFKSEFGSFAAKFHTARIRRWDFEHSTAKNGRTNFTTRLPFSCLLFPRNESRKSSKIRGKVGAKFGAKFGTKIRKIGGTFVLRLF